MKAALYDVGLQPERTELAWRRTALAIAAGSFLAARLLPSVLHNPYWVLPGLGGVVFAGVLWFGARRRYQAFVAFADGDRLPRPSGALQLAALSVFSTGCGLVSLLLAVGAFRGPHL